LGGNFRPDDLVLALEFTSEKMWLIGGGGRGKGEGAPRDLGS